MKHQHIEFLFAHWAVPAVKDLRGQRWRELVTHVSGLSSTSPEALAFALTMVRLNGCVTCDAKKFRERGGCANCARFVLTTVNKESEANLMARFEVARKDVARSIEPIEQKAA